MRADPRPPASPAAPSPRSPRRTVPWAVAAVAAGAVLAGAPGALAAPTGEPVEIASGLNTPWELALAPDGRTFVTERGGGIRVISATDVVAPGNVLDRSEFGIGDSVVKLLGLALAPDFATSKTAYVYVTTNAKPAGDAQASGTNGIWRLKESGGRFVVESRVFDGIPSDGNHDGGRMVFGPDGNLYVSTGDIHQPTRPQDPQSLNGKILRFAVPATGALAAPTDNPFFAQGGNARFVWSLGHRHPQGLAFDAAGRLWESEHGPTGEQHGAQYPGGNNQRGRDEINLVTKGGNYGWPLVSGPGTGPGLTPPVAVAGDSPAWAPGDVAVGADGSLYAPFLAGTQLHRFDIRAGAVIGQADHLQNLGRLRVAVPRGGDMLVAQDGANARIYRVPLSAPTPGGSDLADPLAVAPIPAPPTTAPTPAPTPTPAPGAGGGGSTVDAAAVRSRTRSLARTVRGAARKLGRKRLQAGRTISVRSAGPSAGRTTIELRLRSSTGPLLVRTRPRTTSTNAQRYRVKLGPTGRKRLRATNSRRLVVRVVHRPTGGKAVVGTATVTLARRGR